MYQIIEGATSIKLSGKETKANFQIIVDSRDSNLLTEFELVQIFYFRREKAFSSIEQISKNLALKKTLEKFNDPDKKHLVLAHSTKTL